MDDYSNGIHEASAVRIGGIDQWISIRGKDTNAPVLLVIHGGPGSTLTGLSHIYQRPWEALYTVVNWDQRYSGKTASISGTKPEKEVTFEMMLNDAVEVIDYLRSRFKREKIIILGHSWGTILGATLARLYPEKLIAYISTGTVVNCRKDYKLIIDQLEKVYKARGDKKNLKYLDTLRPYLDKPKGEWEFMLGINNLIIKEGYSSVKAYGLWTGFKYELLPMLQSPEYRLRDFHLTAYKAYIPMSEKFQFEFNLEQHENRYDIPVYYVNGDSDWQTTYVAAKEYAENTVAPDTAFYTLENCAHCWDIDAPDQMAKVMCENIYPRLKKYI